MTRISHIQVLLAALLTLGCAKGVDPPTLTTMVAFGTSGSVEFDFGSEELCCDASLSGCTNGDAATTDIVCGLAEPPPVYPTMRVKIPAFELDEHEVTTLQYQHCVARGSCSKPPVNVNNDAPASYQKYYDEDSDQFADFPVIRVTYVQAQEYCTFAGKRLPTEFEWEAAVQSATTPFVWGATVAGCQSGDAKVAIESCSAALYNVPQAVKGSMLTDELPTDNGILYGMAGNVSEWTSTLYQADVTCAGSIGDFSDNSTGSERACRSSFTECANQTDAQGFKSCAVQMRACTDCLDAADASEMTNPECFGMCTE
ncbi:MAG: hypothetical protein ACI9OJ_003072, partial [Myxococcota bacterium]